MPVKIAYVALRVKLYAIAVRFVRIILLLQVIASEFVQMILIIAVPAEPVLLYVRIRHIAKIKRVEQENV